MALELRVGTLAIMCQQRYCLWRWRYFTAEYSSLQVTGLWSVNMVSCKSSIPIGFKNTQESLIKHAVTRLSWRELQSKVTTWLSSIIYNWVDSSTYVIVWGTRDKLERCVGLQMWKFNGFSLRLFAFPECPTIDLLSVVWRTNILSVPSLVKRISFCRIME